MWNQKISSIYNNDFKNIYLILFSEYPKEAFAKKSPKKITWNWMLSTKPLNYMLGFCFCAHCTLKPPKKICIGKKIFPTFNPLACLFTITLHFHRTHCTKKRQVMIIHLIIFFSLCYHSSLLLILSFIFLHAYLDCYKCKMYYYV